MPANAAASASSPSLADHIEIDLSPNLAGVSDRGLRHARNEDRFALVQSASSYALVVCDGVSMSPEADQAAAAAVEAAAHALHEGLALATFEPIDVLRTTVQRAAAAAAGLRAETSESPSTTFVAAIVSGPQLTVAWMGDSRAYWLPAGEEPVLITRDHSWKNSPQFHEPGAELIPAHALTRWLGADGCDLEPDVVQLQLAGNGVLILCSDGLWNYASEPANLATLINPSESSALLLARHLVKFACDKGGHDNITAAILRYPPGV